MDMSVYIYIYVISWGIGVNDFKYWCTNEENSVIGTIFFYMQLNNILRIGKRSCSVWPVIGILPSSKFARSLNRKSYKQDCQHPKETEFSENCLLHAPPPHTGVPTKIYKTCDIKRILINAGSAAWARFLYGRRRQTRRTSLRTRELLNIRVVQMKVALQSVWEMV